MTLTHHALQYQKYPKDELRTFAMQRQNMSGRECKKSSKRDLVRRLLRLDQSATFRFFDLPPELREHCFKIAVACTSDFTRLCLVSKQVYIEVKLLFYEEAVFNLTLGDPEPFSRKTGDPLFAMSTQYWNQINVHENQLRVTYSEMLFSKHQMFRNIRHLSFRARLFTYISRSGHTHRQFNRAASRALFLICTFYAFTDLHALKTLEYDVEGRKRGSFFTEKDLLSIFWPLKLLKGRVEVKILSMPAGLLGRIDLDDNDLASEIRETCRRFAQCYFSHERPSGQKPGLLEKTRALILWKKMADLAAFDTLLKPGGIWMLVSFVKRMEWMEAKYLDYAEE